MLGPIKELKYRVVHYKSLKTWVVHYKSLWRQNLPQFLSLRCPMVHYSWNEPTLESANVILDIMYIFMSEKPYLKNQACTLETHVFSKRFRHFVQKHPTFSHLYYPSCSESVPAVGDPGRDLELWLLTSPFDSCTESSPRERRISSVIGRGSFVGEGSLGIQCWDPWFSN